jgi:3-oxoacyl-[acyl-carrier-protein] synthase-3
LVKQSRIIGTGSYLPPRVVTNDEIGHMLGLADDEIYGLTGIRSRHWVDPGVATSDLAVEAARRACLAGGMPPDFLEAILVSTTSPDMPFPSTACHVQRALGLKSIPAFDVAASCSGFLYGLSMADAMIRGGRFRSILVIAAEIKSRSLDPTDKETALLFGDGAGAALVVRDETEGPGAPGILGIRLYSGGAGHDMIKVPAGGSRRPTSAETLAGNEHVLRMKGSAVFRAAIRRLGNAIIEQLKEFGFSTQDLAQVIAHQANARILAQLSRRLGLPKQALYTVIERYGNTSSASLPIALDVAVRENRLNRGDVVLLGAFGGGLTWATGLMRW